MFSLPQIKGSYICPWLTCHELYTVRNQTFNLNVSQNRCNTRDTSCDIQIFPVLTYVIILTKYIKKLEMNRKQRFKSTN